MRAARQQRGLSQRQLAERAGLSPDRVARIESGKVSPQWRTVVRLLEAVGLAPQLALTAQEPGEELRRWLALSTSQRLHCSLGGTGGVRFELQLEVWRDLQALARGRVVVLSPAASVGVWLPGRPAPVPLPVTLTGPAPAPAAQTLDVTVGPVETLGLVPVGITWRDDVLVAPPDAVARWTDPVTSALLRTAAAALDAERGRDAAGRRPAAHRTSDVRVEEGWVMTRRRFGDRRRELPDARQRRDWRLGGETSFREWLLLRGYPIRDDRW